ncbi:phage major capsid protein [Vibrio sp. MED222]|uniref:phage major capsid protein n=1 Tax=Vibrio sp. MED222 TaxID=314290 RepID=UPI000068EC07|nr:phage major capsid protein [Vibrio sp. MED222]EAQ55522.1 hypothetical protein MED222_08878 [Vibrio sp. MED222]
MTILRKALQSQTELTQENLVDKYTAKAVENEVILSSVGMKPAKSSKHKIPVLKEYVSVQNGAQGVNPVPSSKSVWVSQEPTFKKVESLVELTHDVLKDAKIDLINSTFEQVGKMTAIKISQNLVNDADFGIASYCIDRANSFAKGLVPDATRDDDIFSVSKSGVSGSWGTDTTAKVQFLGSLIASVPSRYHASDDFAIYMNRATWFDEFNFVEDVTGNVINYNVTPQTWMGYKVVLVDQLPIDAILVGSMSNAYRFVPLEGSTVSNDNDVNIKGITQLYSSIRYSGTPLDNTALRVGVQAV